MDTTILASNFNDSLFTNLWISIINLSPCSLHTTNALLFMFFSALILTLLLMYLYGLEYGFKYHKGAIYFIGIFLVALLFLFSFVFIFYLSDYINVSNAIDRYYVLSKEINNIPFNNLEEANEIRLNNGEIIKVKKVLKYPDDLIVSSDLIEIEIENNNGKAKSITGYYSKKELFLP